MKGLEIVIDADFRRTIDYDPKTGEFHRLFPKNRREEARWKPIGCIGPGGYLYFRFKRKIYSCHRVAWFLATGVQPQIIDHINRQRTDNRLANLRDVTPTENTWNRRIHKNNRSGYKGVSLHACGKYIASIMTNGKVKYLGTFESPEDASEAYEAAARELHGRFSNLTVPGNLFR